MPLAIVNFSRQSLVDKQEVLQAVKRLPREHYAGLKIIRFDPHRTLATYMSYLQDQPSSSGTRGTYLHSWESSESVVIIYPFSSRAELFHALYHEIGHHVFLRVLGQEQRNQWFFQIRPAEEGYVTPRAGKNAREDFAETYACYCANPGRLYRAPLKRDFLQREVFAGTSLQPGLI
ncbi:MAG: hypothetical protein ACOC43_00810 [Desulfohalobiaceae bacterium]